MKKLLYALAPLFLLSAAAQASVTVTSPASGATVKSPVHFIATARTTCTKGVSSMGVYIDHVLKTVVKGHSLDTLLSVPAGTHTATVQEWDNCGHSSFKDFPITVKALSTRGVVTVISPTPGSTVDSPVRYNATAVAGSACAKGVASMGVYVNDKLVYTSKGAALNTSITLDPGPQHTVVEEWDLCGGAGYTTADLTVNSAPPPPPLPVAPTVSLSAAPASIVAGGSASLIVTATDANGITLTGSDGSAYSLPGTGGSQSVTPAATATYTAVANGDGGSASSSATVTVTQPAPDPTGPPADAISSGDLTGSTRWAWTHDPGTPGTATGTSTYPVDMASITGHTREFAASYSAHGGEIYHVSFGIDTTVKHFIYDTNVYLDDPTQIANIEMDMNQVMADGRTVIFGVQCSSYSNSWEFTTRDSSSGSNHWNASNLPCNPKTWPAHTWRHVQIASHRDDNGVVTYDWVSLDGKVGTFKNAVGNSAKSLGWTKGDLLLNFQLDGASSNSGSMKANINKMTIYRW